MSPVRILILLGLFYILFRLLIKASRSQDNDPATSGEAAEATRDVLKEDPVCHLLIPARQAIILKNNGNTLYFCSSDCRSKFITTQGEQQ